MMMMKQRNIFMLAVAFTLSMFTTGCTESDDLTDITSAKQNQQQEQPKPEEDAPLTDDFSAQLAAIDGVADVVVETAKDEETGQVNRFYTFTVPQFVDHNDYSKGTFKQRVRILLNADRDLKAPVVLYTHGYNMMNNAGEVYVPEMTNYLKANTLFVEHRYFGKSLPEPFENLDFTYLYADQAARDLHLVISLMKQTVFKESGKWTSTGVSKDGITTGLYAYYSDKYGWDDIDLYMPFCAPFLPATPTSCDDLKMGQYLYNECGKGYPAGSKEERGYQLIRKIPAALLQDKELYETCLRYFHKKKPQEYLDVIRDFARNEENVTAGVIYCYYQELFMKFSYQTFPDWADLVPDVDKALINATTDVEKQLKQKAAQQVAEFIFMSMDELSAIISNSAIPYLEPGHASKQPTGMMPKTLTDNELLEVRSTDDAMPYYVQAVRELGNIRLDVSALDGLHFPGSTNDFGFLTATISRQSETSQLYNRYADQWDGGQLMKSFLQWVKTQNKYNMIFCYSQNDPWTGGAIDPGTNPRVRLSICRNGTHNDKFLNPQYYSETEKQTLLGYVKTFLGL